MIAEDSGDAGAPVRFPDALGGVVSAAWRPIGMTSTASWERAVAEGAEVVYPLADQFYGERGGRLRDPFGQQWMLSQRTEDISPDEMNRRAAGYFAASS